MLRMVECVEVKKATMMGFHSRSSANVPHCGHTSRLKCNLDPADPTENRNLEKWKQNSGSKETVAIA